MGNYFHKQNDIIKTLLGTPGGRKRQVSLYFRCDVTGLKEYIQFVRLQFVRLQFVTQTFRDHIFRDTNNSSIHYGNWARPHFGEDYPPLTSVTCRPCTWIFSTIKVNLSIWELGVLRTGYYPHLTVECLLWYKQKMNFLNPKFNQIPRKLTLFGPSSDYKIPIILSMAS